MFNRGFLRHLATLLGGTAAGQVIALLAAPFLARLYGPADFALVSAFVGISTILSIIATLRFDLALLLPERDSDAGVVFQLVVLILVVTTVLISFLLWLLGPWLAAVLPAFATAAPVLPLIPVMTLAIGGYQILAAWANRDRAYRQMAGASILNQGCNVVVAVVIGWLKMIGNGLLAGRLVGQALSALWFAVSLRARFPRANARFSELCVAAHRYRQFPYFNVPYSLLGALSQELLVFALLAFHHVGVAGHFVLVRTVLLLPARYLSSSLGLVFFREASQMFGTPALEDLTLKVMRHLGVAVAPLTVFFIVWSEEIFVLAFGSDWRAAGKIAAWYAPVGFLFLFTSWPERLYEVSERQRVSLGIEIGGNIIKLAAVLIPLLMGAGPLVAIAGYAVADAVYHIAYLLGLFYVGGFRITRLVELTGALLWRAGLCAVGCWLFLLTPMPPLAQAAGGLMLALGIAAYSTILLLKQRPSP